MMLFSNYFLAIFLFISHLLLCYNRFDSGVKTAAANLVYMTASDNQET